MELFLLSPRVNGLSHVFVGFKILPVEESAISPFWFINMALALLAVFFLYGFGLEIGASPIFIHMIL